MVGRKQELADEGFGSVALPNCVRPDGRNRTGVTVFLTEPIWAAVLSLVVGCPSAYLLAKKYLAPEKPAAEHNSWRIFHCHGPQEKRPAVDGTRWLAVGTTSLIWVPQKFQEKTTAGPIRKDAVKFQAYTERVPL